jgi:hypothetical protein
MLKKEEIINIAKLQEGRFYVTWRWRDNGLRNLCNKMIKEGTLKKGKYLAGVDIFLLK